MKIKNILKLCIGIIFSIFFLYLAFRNVNLSKMYEAIKNINYGYLIYIFLTMFLYEWLRAWRWQYFMQPIKYINTKKLFSALMIGYTTNIVVPAHLGEFVRAYVASKNNGISASSTFATIVTERLVDMFSLFLIIGFTLFFYPFPDWVKKSCIILLVLTIALFLFLYFVKVKTNETFKFINFILKPLSEKFKKRVLVLLLHFLTGFAGLGNLKSYFITVILTIGIWGAYVLSFYFGFLAFNFQLSYQAGLILVILTTISIVIPSSPGYIGTYHWACQIGLSMFGISDSQGIAFALVMHGILTIPFFFIGLLFAWKESINIFKTLKNKKL